MTNTKQEPADNIDQVISIGGIRGMTKADAMSFLAKKFTFIEGRGIAEEYRSLATEYAEIGEERRARELLQQAQEMSNA